MRTTLLLALALAGCSSTTSDPVDAARVTSDASIDAALAVPDTGIDAAVDAGTTSDDAATSSDDADTSTSDAGPPSDTGLDANTPDSGPCMASGTCNPFDPTSCGAMACRPGASGTSCSAVSATPVSVGGTCARDMDCAPGLVCLTFPGEGPICHRMCPIRSVGACDTGYACNGTFGNTCIDVCRPTPAMCDIYTQNCASATDTCTLVRNAETNAPYTGCRPAGPQAEGQPCGGSNGSCGHALICVSTSGVPACRHVCDPSASSSPCTAPATCSGLATTWGVHFCQ